ncbi:MULTISPECIES: Crp/Fnr family transcriptional regulator [Romboutsia]|jgi:CRP-like cAMP-binding protein|uniref:Cyclic nucleotide-binding domain protein n=1 Tax=Romboutsia ilealis TaxID=1115758 RepID=A0A1V1HYW3_9FIRM|nr:MULTISPECIES: Crp/Fnr family transcriptional regulator [Romboutsia]MCI9061768.1 Crp/Fnr family transcriptional regulator [Romboutsia sp.]MCI9259165.1 Crp/Fnr family transcriptional regulator [Romboutsia sp.]CED93067.1 Cyclic nucleotide-binding domain protein [Romboutsia ilealis]
MFKDKDKDEILELFKGYNYQLINFNKNDIVALEYEPCNKIGLIISGIIDIKRMLSSNNTIHLSSLSSGSLFGEVIAFSDINIYPATVISSTSSEIMFINKIDFIKFCTDNTTFLNCFLNDLTNKIITLNKSITTLSLTSIRQKISNFLLNEYKVQGSIFIKLNMTKQKLSEILGIPRPSLSRELINMKELGIIDYSRDFIKILDKKKLEDLLTQ